MKSAELVREQMVEKGDNLLASRIVGGNTAYKRSESDFYPMFEKCRPTHILPLTWRPDFLFGTRGSGSPLMDVCWCVWDTEMAPTTTYYHPLDRPQVAWI